MRSSPACDAPAAFHASSGPSHLIQRVPRPALPCLGAAPRPPPPSPLARALPLPGEAPDEAGWFHLRWAACGAAPRRSPTDAALPWAAPADARRHSPGKVERPGRRAVAGALALPAQPLLAVPQWLRRAAVGRR